MCGGHGCSGFILWLSTDGFSLICIEDSLRLFLHVYVRILHPRSYFSFFHYCWELEEQGGKWVSNLKVGRTSQLSACIHTIFPNPLPHASLHYSSCIIAKVTLGTIILRVLSISTIFIFEVLWGEAATWKLKEAQRIYLSWFRLKGLHFLIM
jgi:hypothetical protein